MGDNTDELNINTIEYLMLLNLHFLMGLPVADAHKIVDTLDREVHLHLQKYDEDDVDTFRLHMGQLLASFVPAADVATCCDAVGTCYAGNRALGINASFTVTTVLYDTGEKDAVLVSTGHFRKGAAVLVVAGPQSQGQPDGPHDWEHDKHVTHASGMCLFCSAHPDGKNNLTVWQYGQVLVWHAAVDIRPGDLLTIAYGDSWTEHAPRVKCMLPGPPDPYLNRHGLGKDVRVYNNMHKQLNSTVHDQQTMQAMTDFLLFSGENPNLVSMFAYVASANILAIDYKRNALKLKQAVELIIEHTDYVSIKYHAFWEEQLRLVWLELINKAELTKANFQSLKATLSTLQAAAEEQLRHQDSHVNALRDANMDLQARLKRKTTETDQLHLQVAEKQEEINYVNMQNKHHKETILELKAKICEIQASMTNTLGSIHEMQRTLKRAI